MSGRKGNQGTPWRGQGCPQWPQRSRSNTQCTSSNAIPGRNRNPSAALCRLLNKLEFKFAQTLRGKSEQQPQHGLEKETDHTTEMSRFILLPCQGGSPESPQSTQLHKPPACVPGWPLPASVLLAEVLQTPELLWSVCCCEIK